MSCLGNTGGSAKSNWHDNEHNSDTYSPLLKAGISGKVIETMNTSKSQSGTRFLIKNYWEKECNVRVKKTWRSIKSKMSYNSCTQSCNSQRNKVRIFSIGVKLCKWNLQSQMSVKVLTHEFKNQKSGFILATFWSLKQPSLQNESSYHVRSL